MSDHQRMADLLNRHVSAEGRLRLRLLACRSLGITTRGNSPDPDLWPAEIIHAAFAEAVTLDLIRPDDRRCDP